MRRIPASGVSPCRRSRTSTTGSVVPPPSDHRMSRAVLAPWKSILRKPKSHRCTHASRASAGSEIFRQAQPLTGFRDGPPATAPAAPAGNEVTRRSAAQARGRLVIGEIYHRGGRQESAPRDRSWIRFPLPPLGRGAEFFHSGSPAPRPKGGRGSLTHAPRQGEWRGGGEACA